MNGSLLSLCSIDPIHSLVLTTVSWDKSSFVCDCVYGEEILAVLSIYRSSYIVGGEKAASYGVDIANDMMSSTLT